MAKAWVVRGGVDDQEVGSFLENRCIALGWTDVRSLQDIQSKRDIIERVNSEYPNYKPGARYYMVEQLNDFRFSMSVGDGVITYDPRRRLFYSGAIVGEYAYNLRQSGAFPHSRAVQWKGSISRVALSAETRLALGRYPFIFRISETAWQEVSDAMDGAPSVARAFDDEVVKRFRLETERGARELVEDKVQSLSPSDFSKVVYGVLGGMGLRICVIPAGPDRPRAVVASPDGLSLTEPRIRVDIQHRPGAILTGADVRKFFQSLRPGESGLLVTSGGVSEEARKELEQQRASERGRANVSLMDVARVVHGLLGHYEDLDADTRALIPLIRDYWPIA